MEMVVSMVIIGLLSSVVTPTFLGYQRQRAFDFSVDILQTSFYQAFSNARSGITIVSIEGHQNASGYTIFECPYNENIRCDGDVKESVITFIDYENGIRNETSFFLQFLPPLGNIDIQNSHIHNTSLNNTEGSQLTLVQESTEKKRSLRVYPRSGFIEAIFE